MNDPTPNDRLCIGALELGSRLLVGTGKYATHAEMSECLEASGATLVTVALRRVNHDARSGPSLLDHIDLERYSLLPNTAGCYEVRDAVRTAKLGRDLLRTQRVKLEVLGDAKTLLPDPLGTLQAAEELIADGFEVYAYTSDDPRLCVRLAELGCAAVMPAGSPIGSGRGVANPAAIRIVRELVPQTIPVIVDAGIGAASDAAVAMEAGADGVLLNSAIAGAVDPVGMARAMRYGVMAGRASFLAGRMPRRLHANASSPEEGLIEEAGPAPARG